MSERGRVSRAARGKPAGADHSNAPTVTPGAVSAPPSASTARRLRQLLAGPGTVMVPGAHDAITARIVEQSGFQAVYVSGGATANAVFGLPDIELVDRGEIVAHAARIASSVRIPVLSDADTGYGNPLAVRRTVQEFERAGIAAIHIEDQASPKRCGHLAGKEVIPAEEMAAKIRAAVEARRGEDFVVIARTDARAVEGLEAAIRRGRLYREAGADVLFPEALESEAEFRRFAQEVDGPLLANMTEFGRTPYLEASRFAELGYKLVIYPVTSLRVAAKAVREAMRHLYSEGTQRGFVDAMLTREELYDIVDYPGWNLLAQAYAVEPGNAEGRAGRTH